MSKKSIIAILSAVVLMVVASLALVFTIGPKTSADSEVIETVPVECLSINDGVLGDGTDGGAFNVDGKTWIQNHAKYCVEIPSYVTRIGAFAFRDCSGLTSITIPNSVTSIGNLAFYCCSGLTGSITIPEGVTSIGEWAFRGCSGLTSITIPNSVTSIGNSAFNGCRGLTSITIPAGVTSIGSGAFYECRGLASVNIPEGVTSIGSEAFSYCSGLTSITIPAGVTSIGKSAFYCCSGLTGSITIPEGVTSIGEWAFRGCSGLTSITIPEGVTSIGRGAFYYCSGLTSITIPEGVTSIGDSVFGGCSGLTSITVDTNNTEYTSQDNEGHECNCIIEKSSNKLLCGCQSTIIPAGVTSIGDYAFKNCSGLTSITIPNSVTSIGYEAFIYCSGLTSITIPESVTRIDSYAFSCCSGLTSITIPEGVTSIGSNAFLGCSGLTSITIPAGVTSIGYSVFSGCNGLNEIIVRNPDLMTNTNLQSYASKLHYGAEQNTVTFNTMGGNAVDNQIIDFGDFASEPNPEKEGYHVTGWYSDEQYTQPFTFDTPIKYDITLYAKWQINRYTVTFDSNSGSAVANQTVDYGAVINSPVTTRTGYTFKGWLKDGVAYDFSHPITEDMNLIADWDINVYTVTFDACNGNALVEQPVNYNEKAIRPTDPTRASANFKGWYQSLQDSEPFDFDTLITKDITLYAKWENVYMVTFNVDGGTTISSQEIENGQKAEQPIDPTKEHYSFAGWYTNANLTNEFNFNTPITGSMTLYAKWNINRYMVDFNGQGAYVNSVFVNHGDLVAEPTISRTGYTLLGWFVDDEIDQKFNFNTPITDNIGLWAKWSINQYNVIFDSDGGNAVAPQRNVEYNTLLTVPETPTREGYNFLGWYNGDEAYDFATPVSEDMTLTAKWEAVQAQPEPETPDEETSTEVNNQNNNGLLWGILGTSSGILLVGGIVFGIVISKRRRK